MRHKSKKTAEDLIKHFQKRCMERVGYILTQKFLKDEMNNHRLPVLQKQSNSRTLFRFNRKYSEDLVLVYNNSLHTFVTVMGYNKWREDHGWN